MTVETELVPMKEVPLDSASFVTGEPAEGYVLTGVELAVESVEAVSYTHLLPIRPRARKRVQSSTR